MIYLPSLRDVFARNDAAVLDMTEQRSSL